MTDWRGLPAGNALDRLMAERLGWRIAENADLPDKELWPWLAVSPNGRLVALDVSRQNPLDEAWDNAFWAPEGDPIIPRFSRDANAELPLDDVQMETYQFYGNHFTARISVPHSSSLRDIDVPLEEADTLALVRVRAYLAWGDRLAERQKFKESARSAFATLILSLRSMTLEAILEVLPTHFGCFTLGTYKMNAPKSPAWLAVATIYSDGSEHTHFKGEGNDPRQAIDKCLSAYCDTLSDEKVRLEDQTQSGAQSVGPYSDQLVHREGES